ncbi:myotubularin-related protein DDB_G0290005-like [Alligator mississippiensis]|uniref:myotubularin-related protein DDB_G0290005-like n=1 Tax=Alligator mississippiensis TaxID=8496 RepID=UPI0028776AB1|nr:myotubularin-related protein DDB_G0290005-like [Alligator mississippiensis]
MRRGPSGQGAGCAPSAAKENRQLPAAGERRERKQAPPSPDGGGPGCAWAGGSQHHPSTRHPRSRAAPLLGHRAAWSQAHSSPCLSHSSSWDDWHTSQESGSTSPSTSSSSFSEEDPENSLEAQSTSTSSSSSSEDSDSLEESNTTTSTRSSSSEDSSSSLESGTSPAPGATRTVIPSPAGEELEEEEDEEEEEEEDGRSPEEAALLLVKKHLQDPGEMLDGKDRQRFLLAIISLTIAADQSREVAVELEGLKAAVLERIVDLMETISVEADRKHILAYSIDAIRCLSDPKLSLEPVLELRLLRAAVEKSFLAIGRETHRNQVMQRLYEEYLKGLLCCVLSSTPSLCKLYSIWEVSTVQRGWARAGTAPALCTAASLSQRIRKMVKPKLETRVLRMLPRLLG